MYVPQSKQCSMPNSMTPITQARINAQAIALDRQVQPMLDGNSDMQALIAALTPPPPVGTCEDLTNSNALISVSPWPPTGQGGAPPVTGAHQSTLPTAPAASSSGAASTPATAGSSPTPAGSVASAGTAGGGRSGGWGRVRGPIFGRARFAPGGGSPFFGRTGENSRLRGQFSTGQCARVLTVPRVVTPGAAIPAPPATPTPAPTPITTPTPAAKPAAPAWTCPGQPACRTSNICLDLRRGCVGSSQVTQAQIEACAAAGYTGNEDFFPCALTQPNLPFLGEPMPNPPPYSTVVSQDVPPPSSQNWWGLGGLGCDCDGGGPGVLQVLGLAAVIAAGIYFADWMVKQNWSEAA
jgi:hypothetical protein